MVGALYVRFGRAARARRDRQNFGRAAFDHLGAALELPPGVLAYAEADVTTELPTWRRRVGKGGGNTARPTSSSSPCTRAPTSLIASPTPASMAASILPDAVLPPRRDDGEHDAPGGVGARDPVHAAVDVARLGAWASRGYDCRFRTIDDPSHPRIEFIGPSRRASARDGDGRSGGD